MSNSVIKRRFDAPVVNDNDWRREKRKGKEREEEKRKNGKVRAVSGTIDEWNCRETGRAVIGDKRSNANANANHECDSPSYGPGPAPNFLLKLILIGRDHTRTCLDGDSSSKRQIMVKGTETLCLVTCGDLEDLFVRGSRCQAYFKDCWDEFFASVHSYLDISCESLDRAWTGQKLLLESLGRRYEAPGEQRAIKYLQNKMKRNRFLGHEETMQTAITALKYLLAKDLKADEIKVYVFGKDRVIDGILRDEEIEKHLTDIDNMSESESDSSKERNEKEREEERRKEMLAWWTKKRQVNGKVRAVSRTIDEWNCRKGVGL